MVQVVYLASPKESSKPLVTFTCISLVTTSHRSLGLLKSLSLHQVDTRAYRAAEGGERACNVHRRQNAECY